VSAPVAVVICTRDRPLLLRTAVDAALAAIRRDDELVVVDSASRDSSAVAPARAAGVRVVRVEQPGLSRARNAGIATTDAPIIAFTDDDCRPAPGWTEALSEPFEDPRVGFATGRVEADRSGRMSVSVMVDDEGRRMGAGFDPFLAGVGANMAVRRVACEGIAGGTAAGAFDERLGAGARLRAGEDVDVWWRLLQTGWEGVYAPRALVTHEQWRNDAQAFRLAYGYGLGAGALAAKAMREHREGGPAMLGRRLWSDGVLRSLRDLRAGYQTGAAFSLLQAAGTLSGAVQALRWSAR
jgi:glycosyltransferase involved in cell wall biosynthesis